MPLYFSQEAHLVGMAIYDGTFSNTLIEGNGLLGQKLLEKGYKIYNPSTYKDENNQSITSLTIDRESK